MSTVLSVNQLSKYYGRFQALNNLSFEVPEGSIYGILGPNGSGKTTLLGILLDVLRCSSGSFAWLGGVAGKDARKHIGSLLETPNFYPYLSAMDNLEITGKIRGVKTDDRERVLRLVNLYDRRDSQFQTFSLGMKQRLAIAAALLGNTQVLVLDEPTNGLDPVGIAEIRELIKKLSGEGVTVIMASHLLDEVEKVCTHVAIIKKGNLLLEGDVKTALQSEDIIEVKAHDKIKLLATLQTMPGLKAIIQQTGDAVHFSYDPQLTAEQVNEYCYRNGVILSHLQLRKKSLEAKFIEITNKH